MEGVNLDGLVDIPDGALLQEAMKSCATLPKKGFQFQSKSVHGRKPITYEVTLTGVTIVAHDFDDSEAPNMESAPDGQDALRKAMQRLGLEYLEDYNGYGSSSDEPDRWRLSTAYSYALSNAGHGEHRQAWAKLAKAVKEAFNTVLCPCDAALTTHGTRCFVCVLKEGLSTLPPARPPPTSIADLAAAEGDGSEGWADASESAAACGVCRERRSKQLRLEPCGHIYCMACCAGIKRLECPMCSQKAAKAQRVFFS